LDITATAIRLNVRLDSIVYPVDPNEFLNKLNEKKGYSIAQPGRTTTKGVPMQKGDTAFKGDVILNLNPNSLNLALIGIDSKELTQVLDELITSFNECGGDAEKDIKYIEFILQQEIRSERNALESIPLFLNSVPTSEIDAILGSKSELSTIKFTPKHRNYNSTEYCEIIFEPLKRNSGKSYYCSIEYRTKNYEQLQNSLSNIADTVTQLISVIEK